MVLTELLAYILVYYNAFPWEQLEVFCLSHKSDNLTHLFNALQCLPRGHSWPGLFCLPYCSVLAFPKRTSIPVLSWLFPLPRLLSPDHRVSHSGLSLNASSLAKLSLTTSHSKIKISSVTSFFNYAIHHYLILSCLSIWVQWVCLFVLGTIEP